MQEVDSCISFYRATAWNKMKLKPSRCFKCLQNRYKRILEMRIIHRFPSSFGISLQWRDTQFKTPLSFRSITDWKKDWLPIGNHARPSRINDSTSILLNFQASLQGFTPPFCDEDDVMPRNIISIQFTSPPHFFNRIPTGNLLFYQKKKIFIVLFCLFIF